MIHRWWGGALQHYYSNHTYDDYLVIRFGPFMVTVRYRKAKT